MSWWERYWKPSFYYFIAEQKILLLSTNTCKAELIPQNFRSSVSGNYVVFPSQVSLQKGSLFPFLLPSLLTVNCEWLTPISINSIIFFHSPPQHKNAFILGWIFFLNVSISTILLVQESWNVVPSWNCCNLHPSTSLST